MYVLCEREGGKEGKSRKEIVCVFVVCVVREKKEEGEKKRRREKRRGREKKHVFEREKEKGRGRGSVFLLSETVCCERGEKKRGERKLKG